MSLSDITIIMVTYNSGHIIGAALKDLPKNCPAIIVDNASTDDTCAKIKAHKRAGLKLIRNKENLGFGAANNIALRQCKTRYALLLNPDAKIKAADLQRLKASLQADDKAVMAGPLVEDNGKINYRFQPYPLFHRNNPLFRPLFGGAAKYRHLTDLTKPQNCGFISGSVLLYDVQKMPDVLYFDEDIFLYYEETELQSRIIGAGYRLLLEPRARAEHVGNASSRWQDRKQQTAVHFYYSGHSRGVLARKYPDRINRRHLVLFLWRSRLLTLLAKLLGKSFKHAKYTARLQGFGAGFKSDYGKI